MLPTVAVAALAAGYGGVWALGLLSPPVEPVATPLAMRPLPLVRSPEAARFAPTDRHALSRHIQKELTRVSCYEGALNGVWTPATRQSMRAFLVAVNAQLPTDQPDEALLSLLQAQQDAACGAPCKEGDCPNSSPEKTTDAVVIAAPSAPYRIAGQAPPLAPLTVDPPAASSAQALSPASPTIAPPAEPTAASSREPAPVIVSAAATDAQSSKPEPRSETKEVNALDSVELLDNAGNRPKADADVSEPRPQYTAVAPSGEPSAKKKRAYRHRKASRPKQPKFVKSFMRSVNKTLSSLGF